MARNTRGNWERAPSLWHNVGVYPNSSCARESDAQISRVFVMNALFIGGNTLELSTSDWFSRSAIDAVLCLNDLKKKRKKRYRSESWMFIIFTRFGVLP